MDKLWEFISDEDWEVYQKVSWVKYLLELGIPCDVIKKHGAENFSYVSGELTGHSLQYDVKDVNATFKEHCEDEGITGVKELEYVKDGKKVGVKAPDGVVVWFEPYVYVRVYCITTEVHDNPVFNEDYLYILLPNE